MRHHIFFILCAISSACAWIGCEDDSSGSNNNSNNNSVCVSSGGVLDGSRCKCDGVVCDEGVLCNTVTKQCANKLEGGCLYNESDSSENTICNNGRMMTCTDSNLWEAGDICEYGCKADGKDCSECNANICDENDFIKCEDGVKQEPEHCEHGCLDTGCKDACEGNETSCFDAQMHSCNNGQWQDGELCGFGCNDDGSACNKDCKTGDTLCTNGKFKTCSGGTYGAEQSCPQDASCKDAKSCGECKDGEMKADCENGTATKCINGIWSTTKVACNDEMDVSCTSDGKCGECKDDDTKADCEDDKATKCSDGVWSTTKVACNDEMNVSCTSDGKCGECKDGETKADCEDGQVTKCNNGLWGTTKVKCNDEMDVSCTADGKCGECEDGTTKCENGEKELGLLSTCKDGAWGNKDGELGKSDWCKVGSANVSCKEDGTCGECLNSGSSVCLYCSESTVGIGGCTNKESREVYSYTKCQVGKLMGTESPCVSGMCQAGEDKGCVN